MAKRWLLSGVALALAVAVWAADKKEEPAGKATQLAVTTDYLFQRGHGADGPLGANRVTLKVTLDGKGKGKGSIVLDRNIQGYNQYGDPTSCTDMYAHPVEITLTAVKDEDPAKKGRQLYEIHRGESRVRLFLVVSPDKAGPHRLVAADKEGRATHVFPLKSTEKAK